MGVPPASPEASLLPRDRLEPHCHVNIGVRAGRRFQCFLSGGAVVIEVLRLPLQDCIEAVEDRHPSLEQLMIVLCALRKPLHGEVEAERLVPRELAVVQVGFVGPSRRSF